MENIQRKRLFGSNEAMRSERAITMDELNRLAHAYDVTSFNDLCCSDYVAGTASSPRPATGIQQIVNKGMQIAGGVFNAEQVVVGDQAQAFKVTHDIWSK